MRNVTYSSFRKDMKSELRACRDDAEPVLIVNLDESENAVVINVRDYEALMETIRIYENRPLHDKILKGLEELRSGAVQERDLLDA